MKYLYSKKINKIRGDVKGYSCVGYCYTECYTSCTQQCTNACTGCGGCGGCSFYCGNTCFFTMELP